MDSTRVFCSEGQYSCRVMRNLGSIRPIPDKRNSANTLRFHRENEQLFVDPLVRARIVFLAPQIVSALSRKKPGICDAEEPPKRQTQAKANIGSSGQTSVSQDFSGSHDFFDELLPTVVLRLKSFHDQLERAAIGIPRKVHSTAQGPRAENTESPGSW